MIQFTIFSALLVSYCSLVQSQKLGGCPAEPPTVPDFNATAVSEILLFSISSINSTTIN